MFINGIPVEEVLNTPINNIDFITVNNDTTRIQGTINSVHIKIQCECGINKLSSLLDIAITSGCRLEEILDAVNIKYKTY